MIFCCLYGKKKERNSGWTKSVSPQKHSNVVQTLKYSDTLCSDFLDIFYALFMRNYASGHNQHMWTNFVL